MLSSAEGLISSHINSNLSITTSIGIKLLGLFLLIIELFKDNLKDAKRVIMNGPMGVFENKLYENGTREILEYLARNNIKTLIGGGDSVSSVNKFNLANSFYHVSTGGGATLEYLEGKILPGIGAISDE